MVSYHNRIIKTNFAVWVLWLLLMPIARADDEEGQTIFEPPYYMPQAPEAQALARAIDIPISYYSGLPNVSIPLYEINVGNMTIPITLNYHAGGILAEQEATSVGLGWSLSAGGAITRSVKHVDDFLEYPLRSQGFLNKGYFDVTEKWSGIYPDYNYIGYRGYITCDTEPDIYYYSLPNESGKFVFERDTTPIFIKKPCNIQLKTICAGSSAMFEITDSKGNIYSFDKKERTHIYTRSGNDYSYNWSSNGYDIDQNLIGDTNYETEDYTSSWLLTRILTVSGDTVNFEYEAECFQLPLMDTSIKQYLVSTTSQWTEAGDAILSVRKTLVLGWRLKRILWRGGVVDFHFEDREDMRRILNYSSNNPKRTSGITVSNAVGNIVARWLFYHSYFNDDKIGTYAHLFKRLKLDSLVNVLDSSSYKLGYFEDNGRRMPLKNTKDTDYWGYYNGISQGKNFFCPTIFGDRILGGADKEPRPSYAMLGSLSQITWPTGGTTTFEYEGNEQEEGELRPVKHNESLHVFDDEFNTEYPTHLSVSLTLDYTQTIALSASLDFDGAGVPSIPSSTPIFTIYKAGTNSLKYSLFAPYGYDWAEVNNYAKTDSITLSAGTYIINADAIVTDLHCQLDVSYYDAEVLTACGGLRIKRISGEKNIDYSYTGGIMLSSPCYAYYVRDIEDTYMSQITYGNRLWINQSSSSVRPLSTLKDGYTIGYTKVTETFADSSKVMYTFNNNREELLSSNDDYCPFFSTDFNWYNGLLHVKEIFESDGDILLKETTDYSQQDSSIVIWGYMYRYFEMFPYELQINWAVPTLTTIEQFFDSLNLVKTTTIEKEYNDNLLPRRIITSLGNDQHVTEYRYATDYTDSVSNKMKKKNIIGQPVSRFYSRNGRIFSGSRIVYQCTNGLILPAQLLSLNTDGNHSSFEQYEFDTLVTYHNYNRYGKPQELAVKGMPIVYIWGYKGLYPIAEIKNATLSQVHSRILPARIDVLLDKPFVGNNDNDFVFVSDLRGAFGETAVTTCLFKPLVGVMSITDPSGINYTYSYDSAGRLSKSLRGANELLQRYSYHYYNLDDSTNWVRNIEYLTSDSTQSMVSVQFYDSWGRPSQKASCGSNTSGKFLYSLQTYDMLNRPWRTWVDVPSANTQPSYLSEEEFSALSFSRFEDEFAYEETTYDGLGNVIERTTPGSVWHYNGKSTISRYITNTVDDMVKRYQVSANGSLVSSGYYAAGVLDCVLTVDPDGHIKMSYKDLFGNVVLERWFTGTDTLETYRVYDDLNRLRYILPPLCQEGENNMLNCRYEYGYNGKGLVTTKTLPGCQPVTCEYDEADRVTMMQDGELRASGRTRHYVYDSLGRLKRQYTQSGGICSDELINYYDDYDYLDQYPSLPPFAIDDELDNSLNQLTGQWLATSNGEGTLTTYQYDDYGRLCKTSIRGLGGRVLCSDLSYTFWDAPDVQVSREYERIGNALSEKFYCAISKDYYSFTKLPHRTFVTLRGATNSVTQTDTIRNFTYDDFGNVTSDKHGSSLSNMNYSYDLLHGWVKEISSTGGFQQKLYREDNTNHPLFNGSISAMTWKVPNNSILRRYDFTYDDLNRLTEGSYSQLPSITPPMINSTGSDPLALGDLENEAMLLELIPVSDGMGGGLVAPALLNAIDRYTERIAYDRNSNISSIERYGMNNLHQYGMIDSLVITRNGNQLKTIEDYAEKQLTYTGASDFYDGMTNNNEYGYNTNGALVKDLNREIGIIEYDFLGNVRNISFHNANPSSIGYIYAADGTKLRTIHRTLGGANSYIDSIDYVGNLIIKNGLPSMYMFDGGYVSFSNDTIDGWHYYIQDYMGNNRMVVNSDGTVEQVTHYYPYGGIIGDISTNENLQKYKFEGKELDRIFGLDNYDIHARQYFAMAPMWDRIDPLTEDNPQFSPYSYCMGDPVNNGDFNGMDTLQFNRQGKLVNTLINQDKKAPDVLQTGSVNDKSEFVVESSLSLKGKMKKTQTDVYETTNDTDGTNAFEYLAENTDVEWSQTKTGKTSNNKNYLSTSHDALVDRNIKIVLNIIYKNKVHIREVNHSHPSGNLLPSGMRPKEGFAAGEWGDIEFARSTTKVFGYQISFNVYSPKKKKYIEFNQNSTYSYYINKYNIFPDFSNLVPSFLP